MSDFGFSKRTTLKIFSIIIIVVVVFMGLATLSQMMVTVPAGYKGVLLTWGQATSVFDEGLHWITPYMHHVELMNIQVQKAEAEESTASFDLQEVTTSMAVNYRLNPGYVLEIYQTLRQDYEERVIRPAIEESIKASTSGFTAEQLIQQREQLKAVFKENLEERLNMFYIEVIAVSVTNFAFSPGFTEAIEKKATMLQMALEEKNRLDMIYYQSQQKVIQAQAEANATITKATAEASARLIQAQSEAEAIRLMNEQLATNPAYLQYVAYMQWNGQLPWFWGGGALPIINIPMNSTSP